MFDPWVGKIPWKREWLPNPGLLLADFMTVWSMWGKESDTTERFSLIISTYGIAYVDMI